MATIPLTVKGAEKLKQELHRLKTIDRPAVINAISEARAQGDLSENAEYDAAKEKQGFIEGRIKEIEGKMSNAQIIDPTNVDAEGRVVLLNFWATWCEPCKVEMPSMEALHRDYAPHGLDVVAVSEDDARVSVTDLRAYAEDLGLTFDILRDTTHDVARAYQVLGYPTTFVIARDGTIRRRWIGPEDWNSASNRAFMRQLLGIEQAGGE